MVKSIKQLERSEASVDWGGTNMDKINKFDLIDSIIQDERLRTKKYQNVEMVACTYNDGQISRPPSILCHGQVVMPRR
ncbi:hypothetical protein QE152_g30922 [Popillia japonica]|uniref:Uncharacterized protein n=1 Tax=Popillia japonica TaxID=7064 RepID=A0AAW1JD22_POPJA